MIDRKAMLISLSLIVLMTVAGLGAWAMVPDGQPIAVHFDMDGNPNGWMPPAQAFLFAPGISLVMWGFFVFIRRLDPSKPLRAEAAMYYAPAVLVAITQGYLISRAFHVEWGTPKIIGAAIGITWVMTGNVMGKLAPNRAFGVRTPWTLADPHVWDRTNRFGGRLMVLAGLAEIAISLFMPIGLPMLAIIVALPVFTTAAILLKSWLLWRERHPSESAMTRPGVWWPLAIGAVVVAAVLIDLALEQGRYAAWIAVASLVAVALMRRWQSSRHPRP